MRGKTGIPREDLGEGDSKCATQLGYMLVLSCRDKALEKDADGRERDRQEGLENKAGACDLLRAADKRDTLGVVRGLAPEAVFLGLDLSSWYN